MNIKRRDFLGFFLIGGLVGLVQKKIGQKIAWANKPHPASPSQGEVQSGEKEAMFWRRKA